MDRFPGWTDLDLEDVWQADKSVWMAQGEDAHAAGHYRAKDGSNGGAGDAQGGESEVTFDEQIVAADVQDTGGDVGGHGDAGVAAAPKGGVDGHGDDAEDDPTHDDAEIGHCRCVGVRLRAAQVDDGVG